jgi:hypothetical protein
MVKTMAGVIALIVIVLVVVWYRGGYAAYDPEATGRADRAKLTTGMPWRQVLDAVGDPGHWRMLRREKIVINGEEFERLVPGARVEFDRRLFESDLAAGLLPEGFIFLYFYSHQVAIDVHFDATGTAVAIEDATTMADLLQTRER